MSNRKRKKNTLRLGKQLFLATVHSVHLSSSVNMVIYCLWNAQFRKTAKNVALYLYICVRRGDRAAALR